MRTASSFLVAAALLLTVLGGRVIAGDADGGDYRVEMIATRADAWDAIRYRVSTGESWMARKGGWVKMKDSDVLPASRYRVYMTPLVGNWGALRIDEISGRSWRAEEDGWKEIAEPAAKSASGDSASEATKQKKAAKEKTPAR